MYAGTHIHTHTYARARTRARTISSIAAAVFFFFSLRSSFFFFLTSRRCSYESRSHKHMATIHIELYIYLVVGVRSFLLSSPPFSLLFLLLLSDSESLRSTRAVLKCEVALYKIAAVGRYHRRRGKAKGGNCNTFFGIPPYRMNCILVGEGFFAT